MTYRGTVNKGVVVLEGNDLPDGTVVDVTPSLAYPATGRGNAAAHPALGIWTDRRDLPDDAVEASRVLRQRLMRRADE